MHTSQWIGELFFLNGWCFNPSVTHFCICNSNNTFQSLFSFFFFFYIAAAFKPDKCGFNYACVIIFLFMSSMSLCFHCNRSPSLWRLMMMEKVPTEKNLCEWFQEIVASVHTKETTKTATVQSQFPLPGLLILQFTDLFCPMFGSQKMSPKHF